MNSPRIYTTDDHRIRSDDIDVEALKVVQRLAEQGYESYIVGGAVRDLLIGKRPKDFDVATAATPEEVKKAFRNSRLIGRRFRIAHVYFRDRKTIEVSTFRREPTDGEEPNGDNNLWGTAEDDAIRRDLTINAFMLNPSTMEILDYVEGMEDLQNRLVRIIGDPARRIEEDPVRMIRAIRHAARSGFLIEDGTWQAILDNAARIGEVNESRVSQEFTREFQEGAASRSLKLLHRSGLLGHLLPPFSAWLDGLESRSEQKRTYGKLLELLDSEGSRRDLPSSLIMAAAMGPAVAPEILAVIGSRSELKLDELAAAFEPYVAAINLPKGLVEPLAQVLYAQPRLDQARKSGTIPKRLRGKSYFALAMHLFYMRHRAIGSWMPEDWVEQLPALNEDPRGGDSRDEGGEERRGRGRSKGGRGGQGRGQGQGKGDGGGGSEGSGEAGADGRKKRRRRRRGGGGGGDAATTNEPAAGSPPAGDKPTGGSGGEPPADGQPRRRRRRRGGRGRKSGGEGGAPPPEGGSGG